MASLQSELAKEKLQNKIIEVDSVVYLRDDEIFLESNAILMILKDIGGFYKFLYWLLRLFPFRFRQFVYRWVARNRYKWFGTCSLD
jgi:predicted DCC family thiol-disulfide oxidoreductase YuxK